MIYEKDELTPYQELAAAVVRLACVDYVDAQIIINRKGQLTPMQVKGLYNAFIKYGQKRYAYYYKGRLITQTEIRNKQKLSRLKDRISSSTMMYRANQEIELLERFFYGDRFAIFMPHTDPERLIELLQRKAERKEKISSSYESFLKYKGETNV